jgi:hypothetical protein
MGNKRIYGKKIINNRQKGNVKNRQTDRQRTETAHGELKQIMNEIA